MTNRAVTINQTLFMKTFIILSKNTTKIKQHNGLWHDMKCRNFKIKRGCFLFPLDPELEFREFERFKPHCFT